MCAFEILGRINIGFGESLNKLALLTVNSEKFKLGIVFHVSINSYRLNSLKSAFIRSVA